MPASNRSDKTIKNLFFSMLLFIIELVLKFAVRTVFVRVLVVELLGLNGLFSNILQVLSLAELGIGSALTFSMYKPSADGDNEKLASLYKYYKKIYSIIITIILIVGVAIAPFLKYLIHGTVPDGINLYVIYFIFILNTALSYLSAHKKSLLLASQRQDLNSKSELAKTLFLNVSQLVVLLLFKNYYVYIIFLPLSTILDYVITSIIIKKQFSNISSIHTTQRLDTDTKQQIKTNTVALIYHKIGGTLVYSVDNILISSILGLSVLAIYSNYYLIISSLILLISAMINAMKGSIGNFIAKETSENSEKLFNKINFIYMWMVGLFVICTGCLFQSFMQVWVGESLLFNKSTVLLLTFSFYLNISRSMTYNFKECAGLLKQDKYRPIYEATINLVVSLILGKLIGVNGIIIGTIVSTIVGPSITEPFVLYKHLFKKSPSSYYLNYILQSLIILGVFILTNYLCGLVAVSGICKFIVQAIICVVVVNISFLIVYGWTKTFKDTINWLKSIKIRNFRSK